MSDVRKSHECDCQKNWEGIEFTEARRLDDGSVGLVHECETHPNEECVHVLSRAIVEKIAAAISAR